MRKLYEEVDDPFCKDAILSRIEDRVVYIRPVADSEREKKTAVDFITWYSRQMNTEEGRERIDNKGYEHAFALWEADKTKEEKK